MFGNCDIYCFRYNLIFFSINLFFLQRTTWHLLISTNYDNNRLIKKINCTASQAQDRLKLSKWLQSLNAFGMSGINGVLRRCKVEKWAS